MVNDDDDVCTGTATSSSFLLSSRHRHCSFMIAYRWGGVGWGGVITFMLLCTHRHSNLIIFLAVLQTQALLFHDTQDAREIAIPHNKHAFPPDAHTHKHITNIYAAGIKPFAER